MNSIRLTSKKHENEGGDAIEFCFQQNWTDGLPVVPPTEARIRNMLAGLAMPSETEITYIGPRRVSVTAEKVAINAVMAGCLPVLPPFRQTGYVLHRNA
jgi:hypothetical protein